LVKTNNLEQHMGEINEAVKTGSRGATTMGICVLILGILATAMPFVTGLAITISIGLILLGVGIAQIIFAFQSHSFGKGLLRFGFGVLAALCGMSLVSQPDAGLATITLFLAAWFVADGLVALFMAFSWRPQPGWGWMLFNGLLGVVLGIMIYNQFPASATWLVGLLVGIRLLFAGWTMIALGSVMRAGARQADEAMES
jgi:uncharacterized membrane protein HdeD (DUF308 family)